MESHFETIPFTALDGFQLNLKHYKANNATKGPVLLVHGAGVRANIFYPPFQKNLVQMLAQEGYDVWLENWRASIDFEPNQWDLDLVAKNDHPAAVQKVIALTGASEIKAIIHCQGSTSFMISVMLGLVPQVTTIVSNAVSLHPIVPVFSKFKLNVLVPMVKPFFKYFNPQWGREAPNLKTKFLQFLVLLTHPEKDTRVGKFISFTYGSGMPALWQLNNLNEEIKDWVEEEFAHVPLTFFDHIKACVNKGVLIPNQKNTTTNYALGHFPKSTRVALFGGEKNKCFLSKSQETTFKYLESVDPGHHTLHLLKNYSHLDVFFGKNAHLDVFPLMINELN